MSVDSEEPKTVVSQKKNKSKLCVNPRSPCLTCNNNVESIVPLCTWYQNKNYIFLRFDILEINDFRINCTHENIIFEYEIYIYIILCDKYLKTFFMRYCNF